MKGLYVIAILGLCLAFASAGRRHRKPLVCSITESESVTESRECPMDRNCTAGPVSISLGEQNAEVHFCQKDDSSEEQETDEDEIMKRLSRAILRPACKVFNETHTLFERNCTGENMECLVTVTLNIDDQTVAAKYCKDTTIDEFSYLEAFTGQRENIRPETDDGLFRPIDGDKDDERSEESEDRSGGRRGGRRGGRKGGRQRNRSSDSDSDESSVEDDTNEQRRFRGGRASRIQFRRQ